MTCDLPHGTPVVFRYQGRNELWEVKNDLPPPHAHVKGYGRVLRPLRAGEVVHRCIWKHGDTLVSRESYTLTQDNVLWTGDKNVFPNAPKWLRDAY